MPFARSRIRNPTGSVVVLLLLAATAAIADSRSEPRDESQSAADSVVAREEIRRAGAAIIPDVVPMIPGLQAAQAGNGRWDVTVRGGKILVLIDGQSTGSDRNEAGYWDQQSAPVGAIERIEVWRGAEAVQWCAGAVNGLLNLITQAAQPARDTRPPRSTQPRSACGGNYR